jgi:hypothetical protein
MTCSGTADDEEKAVQAEGGLPARLTSQAGGNAAGNSKDDVCNARTSPLGDHRQRAICGRMGRITHAFT